MTSIPLGQIVYSFIEDHLKTQKGLRPLSIKSYRDTLRLFLIFAARDTGRRIARLSPEHLTFERMVGFLRHLEGERRNQIRTRNQRLAALHGFFEYLASRVPEMMAVAERDAAIPTKRTPLKETRFLDRDEIGALFAQLPKRGSSADRDRALLLFLYNTGARVQEVADLRLSHLGLGSQPRVHLHGKGDKWRSCPLWEETVAQLRSLIDSRKPSDPSSPVFASRSGRPLTRFAIYKIVCRRPGARSCAAPGELSWYLASRFSPYHGSASARGGRRN
jgi:integrase